MKMRINIPDIPGRAKTEEQKREVIERLYNAWIENPDLRLGQLICNNTYRLHQELFYIEDDEIV